MKNDYNLDKVVVSRNWDNPNIELFINAASVGARMELYDFINAVLEEVGNPTLLVTKAALNKKISEATAKVVAEMKNQTVNI